MIVSHQLIFSLNLLQSWLLDRWYVSGITRPPCPSAMTRLLGASWRISASIHLSCRSVRDDSMDLWNSVAVVGHEWEVMSLFHRSMNCIGCFTISKQHGDELCSHHMPLPPTTVTTGKLLVLLRQHQGIWWQQLCCHGVTQGTGKWSMDLHGDFK